VASVDEPGSSILLDVGNALPTQVAPGPAMLDVGPLSVQCTGPDGQPLVLGTLASSTYAQDPAWYAKTAGVVALPLSPAQLQAALTTPLAIVGTDGQGNPAAFITEDPSGQHVRADQFVFRLNPGPNEPDNQAKVRVFASAFGKPLPGVNIYTMVSIGGLSPQTSSSLGTPATALPLPPPPAPTDANGMTTVTFTASDPKSPRTFLDGQLYGFAVSLQNPPVLPPNPWDFISVLVWTAFTPDNPVTWYGTRQGEGTANDDGPNGVGPIFKQYAVLYPVMKRFLDLSDPAMLVKNADLLSLAFGLPMENANSMPVTRDLSWAKRQAILQWLKNPVMGTPPVPAPAAGAALAAAAAPPAPASPGKGSKMAAMARRLSVLHPGQF
jgi:hypothetical protein